MNLFEIAKTKPQVIHLDNHKQPAGHTADCLLLHQTRHNLREYLFLTQIKN